MYKRLNINTKKAQGFISSYNYGIKNKWTELNTVYNTYSYNKQMAFNRCKALEEKHNGFLGVITGHNCMTFTYAFLGTLNDEFGLFYITKDNKFFIPPKENN